MSGVMVLDRPISHDHDMQMPGSLSSLLERLCIAFTLALAASGRYRSLSAMLDQAASAQWADRVFQAFFSCHRPVSIALHICISFHSSRETLNIQTSKRLDRGEASVRPKFLTRCIRRKNPRGNLDKRMRAPPAWFAPSTQYACFAPNCSNINHNRFYSFE